MQYCSFCQKAPATITIMDLAAGNVTREQHLCAPCAENQGIVQSKSQVKMSPEILEELLSTMHGKSSSPEPRRKLATDCPGCSMSLQQFKSGGRLGCPRCYEAFREELIPLLQRVHEAASHRGRLPTGGHEGGLPDHQPLDADEPADEATQQQRQLLADLRRRLDEAIRNERYEEAASLRDELQRAENREVGS
jgi:protein arginine kinase activator